MSMKNKNTKRGAASLEYLMLVALFFIILLPFSYLVWQTVQGHVQSSQAQVAVHTIVSAVDSVYAQGPGAKTTADIYLPTGVENASIYTKEISLRVRLSNGVSTEIFELTSGNVTGTLPTRAGKHLLHVEMFENGTVAVGE
ncbi:MAG: hypothetical protein ABIH99_01880 [Candidatus Micrarchaeota archaeon]